MARVWAALTLFWARLSTDLVASPPSFYVSTWRVVIIFLFGLVLGSHPAAVLRNYSWRCPGHHLDVGDPPSQIVHVQSKCLIHYTISLAQESGYFEVGKHTLLGTFHENTTPCPNLWAGAMLQCGARDLWPVQS